VLIVAIFSNTMRLINKEKIEFVFFYFRRDEAVKV